MSTTEALVAAQATLKDFTSFCSRQPDVCAAGEVAIDNFSAKARYGAKQLYLYLDRDSDGSAPQENAIQESTPADEKLAMNDPTVSQLQQERQVLAEIVRSAE
nr:DUF5330 domain-containing protein [uncultured Cohaesibacter sp.]